MKYCDDCKWCSVNFTPTDDNYSCPEYTDDARYYRCMHPKSSEGSRYDCKYCASMRRRICGQTAVLFEEKDKVSHQNNVNKTTIPQQRKRAEKRYELYYCVEAVLISLFAYNCLLFAVYFWVAVWRREGLVHCLVPLIAVAVFFIAMVINYGCRGKYKYK